MVSLLSAISHLELHQRGLHETGLSKPACGLLSEADQWALAARQVEEEWVALPGNGCPGALVPLVASTRSCASAASVIVLRSMACPVALVAWTLDVYAE